MKIIKVLTLEGRISTLTLLYLVLSGVGALQLNIPQEAYEHARGDNITLPYSFTPKAPLKGGEQVIISWSAEGAQAGAKEISVTEKNDLSGLNGSYGPDQKSCVLIYLQRCFAVKLQKCHRTYLRHEGEKVMTHSHHVSACSVPEQQDEEHCSSHIH